MSMMNSSLAAPTTARVNMAGKDEVFNKAIPMNSIGLFGLHTMTKGTYNGKLYKKKF